MKKRILITTFLLLLTITPITTSVKSAVMKDPTATFSDMQPYANQTGYKYKIIDGKLYKRLWSYTYNRWEESKWTLV